MRSAANFKSCAVGIICGFSASVCAARAETNPGKIDWQQIDTFSIARTETTIAQFRRFAQATRLRTQAELQGGGEIYEAGWVKKPGWTWATPFGAGSSVVDDEPAAHVTFHEAVAFCAWAGGRLPTDAEWVRAAFTETRAIPPSPFTRGKTYPLPSGDTPAGQQCLGDCDDGKVQARAVRHGARLERGYGHARVATTVAGVNGLHDMGGNLWEWVDDPRVPVLASGASDNRDRRTRGGSWWYGAAQMRADHAQFKPANTTVGYIGFRCVR